VCFLVTPIGVIREVCEFKLPDKMDCYERIKGVKILYNFMEVAPNISPEFFPGYMFL